MPWRPACIRLLAALLLVAISAQAEAAPRPAPAFSLELFDGKVLSLETLRGKAVVLLFWAPW